MSRVLIVLLTACTATATNPAELWLGPADRDNAVRLIDHPPTSEF